MKKEKKVLILKKAVLEKEVIEELGSEFHFCDSDCSNCASELKIN